MHRRDNVHAVGILAPIFHEVVPFQLLHTGVVEPRIIETLQVPEMQMRVNYAAGTHELNPYVARPSGAIETIPPSTSRSVPVMKEARGLTSIVIA
jgi:hypothetical protein